MADWIKQAMIVTLDERGLAGSETNVFSDETFEHVITHCKEQLRAGRITGILVMDFEKYLKTRPRLTLSHQEM